MADMSAKTATETTTCSAKTQAVAENLTEQLRMAGQVQRDFLPGKLPSCGKLRWATTFLPAEWVSGDIYDVARLDEKHIGFYVADVVGHGVPAALLTMFLKQAMVMRETTGSVYRIFSPAEVMTNLNLRLIGQKLSGNQFITCCYCLLNIETFELTYARAGHPYPILMRSEHEPKHLETKGSLLGIFEHTEFVQQTVQLQSGDKFLLYSDGAETIFGGITEQGSFNFSKEFCETKDMTIDSVNERLAELVHNPQLMPSEIDDITLVGLEIL